MSALNTGGPAGKSGPHTPAPLAPRLGTGGTSLATETPEPRVSTNTKMAAGAAGAATAVPAAAVVAQLMAFLAWLKTLFFAALALGLGLMAMVGAAAMMLLKGAVAAFGAVSAGIVKAAAVVGITVSSTVASAMAGVLLAGSALGIGAVVDAGSPARHEGAPMASEQCVVGGNAVQTVAYSDTELSGAELAQSQMVYSVLATWGMPDENIAGILGNWKVESGVDPTAVEAIFDERYRIGPRKQEAWNGNFTHIAGQAHGGIGLGQWSNSRTTRLLDFAAARGWDWHTAETQLTFMIEGDYPHSTAVIREMIAMSQGSPAAAAVYFHDEWERSSDTSMDKRIAAAEAMYAQMSSWEVDESVAERLNVDPGAVLTGVSGASSAVLAGCVDANGVLLGSMANVDLVDGGLNRQQAQDLVDLYNREGNAFLRGRYGSGGPASCNGDKTMNCVSFSTYFANKYTQLQGYPRGNGSRTAYSAAEMLGKQVSTTPTPYAIGSSPAHSPYGHTMVVLGIEGDTAIVGEAGYCMYNGRIREVSISSLRANGWVWVDMSDVMLSESEVRSS